MSEKKQWNEMSFKEKFLGCSTLIVITIIVAVSITWLASTCSNSNALGHRIVSNEGTDGKVVQVEEYLEKNLNDPSSYQSIEWSNVIKSGNIYLVRHKYRAKNGFGALMVYEQVFSLDSLGNVVAVTKYTK